MLAPAPRPRSFYITLWASAACFVAFLVLAGIVKFSDDSFYDPARMAKLQEARLVVQRSTATDWPQWRGPHRDGVSADTGLLPSWPDDLLQRRKRWEHKTGEGFSSVVVAGGRAYTLFQDGDSEAVVCWDAVTGDERWRFRYRCHYVNGFGSGPRSTPTVDGDRVYTVGGTGLMHCLKTEPASSGGEVVWAVDLLKEFHAENLKWGVSFSPLIEGDLVYVNPGGPGGYSVAALNKHTGATVWHALDDPAGYSSPVAATLANRRQIVFFTGNAVLGVSPADGALYWRYSWPTQEGVNSATPVVVGDYVFITSAYGRGCALLKIEDDGSGGQRPALVYKNRRLLRGHFSSPVFYQGHIYGFDDSRLICLDFRTGQECWRVEQRFNKGSLLIADGRLIILGEYGTLALAEANPKAYRELSVVPLFDRTRCWSVPALANGLLYVRNEEQIVCLDLERQSRARSGAE
jgi:outer membrane protein assembly factor BamB